MTFYDHLQQFDGKVVYDFVSGEPLRDPATATPRVRIEYDDETTVPQLLMELLSDPQADQLQGLVIGFWSGDDPELDSSDTVETLVAAADQLASLKAIFLGDVLSEENEVSWMMQCDISPLWSAFPNLTNFGVRGSNHLSVGTIELDQLETLVMESGGAPRDLLLELMNARYPSLKHFELYLGDDGYGWDGTPEDVQNLLDSLQAGCPQLKYLGLRDSSAIDELAPLIAAHPLLERIEVLDLSLGTLSDIGGQALLDSPAIRSLKKLDLHHHFMTPEMMARLTRLPIDVDVNDANDPDDEYRYVAVGE
ncbi:STM4015 family protein [Lignipirellula cremea]|uniref:Leucine Rich repeats (2 copies) n=1 Tax=Lignipirellula cremea TaxID=2528010 RepID=A0A518DNG4_9BACT|nr:STM4015 family protein [Lignipirellula cremea]QDU93371.1 hypothetical protein Pla8534_11510 [Lignipirellula cremea]